VIHHGGLREVVMQAGDIPATLHGMAEFNTANALAVIAMCVAQDVPLLTIKSALGNFQSTYEQNPGRLNVHDAYGFRVIVDYAHNPAGLTALGAVVNGLRHRHRRSIGVISIPGDRRDEDILEMGRIAGGMFDELFFREDPGTRGRTRGQVMALLRDGALSAGHELESIHLIRGELEATQAALKAAAPNDLVVITPTLVDECWKLVTGFRPEGAPAVPTLQTAV
jgi:cyanophycin synthetase